jgi:hypothetical protein
MSAPPMIERYGLTGTKEQLDALRDTVEDLMEALMRPKLDELFGEQMRAETERDAARRELAEIRFALGDLVNAGGNKGLAETVAGVAEYAMRTSDCLIETSDERDRLRRERDDARLALAMARGEEWPEGWEWSIVRGGYQPRDRDCYIAQQEGRADVDDRQPLGWRVYRPHPTIMGGWGGGKIVYPDPLAALRAILETM